MTLEILEKAEGKTETSGTRILLRELPIACGIVFGEQDQIEEDRNLLNERALEMASILAIYMLRTGGMAPNDMTIQSHFPVSTRCGRDLFGSVLGSSQSIYGAWERCTYFSDLPTDENVRGKAQKIIDYWMARRSSRRAIFDPYASTVQFGLPVSMSLAYEKGGSRISTTLYYGIVVRKDRDGPTEMIRPIYCKKSDDDDRIGRMVVGMMCAGAKAYSLLVNLSRPLPDGSVVIRKKKSETWPPYDLYTRYIRINFDGKFGEVDDMTPLGSEPPEHLALCELARSINRPEVKAKFAIKRREIKSVEPPLPLWQRAEVRYNL